MTKNCLFSLIAVGGLLTAFAGCEVQPATTDVIPEETAAMPSESDIPSPDDVPQDATSAAAASQNAAPQPTPQLAQATFGAGCFWCVEAVFQRLEGVTAVESGYSGGQVENPTYEQVCRGTTGHAEVARITYDPAKVSFEELLEVFWKTHDPTTLNRQGADVGTQYRSAIFYHDEQQRQLAEKYKKALDESGAFDAPIVTEISPLKNYYKAEGYHQNYYNDNPLQGYCRAVIGPKLEKFEKAFKDKLKKPQQ